MEIDVERLVKIAHRLPKMDYFQILNVSTEANDREIKAAFRKRSASFHPDRFFSEDAKIKELVSVIYKQISIAYNATKATSSRQIYLELLTADRETNLRVNPLRIRQNAAGDIEQKKQAGPGAKYYEMALECFSRKDKRSGTNNIKLALTMEKDNLTFLRLKEQLENL